MSKDSLLSRRALLKAGALGTVAAGGAAALRTLNGVAEAQQTVDTTAGRVVVHGSHDAMIAVGNLRPGQLDPSAFLTHFDYGTVSRLPNGQTLRELEVAPGVFYPAWTYNGQVPGPTIRCTEGDRVRIHFTNRGSHIHSVHFHGVHPANMDGAFEMIPPGERFVYEFDAEPFGCHLYHCHTVPIKRHIHKGLYGAFIIDPRDGRPPATEMVMMMNGFDTNFDNENEVYAINTVAFHYQKHPIPIKLGELTRIYLINITEFDLLNSMHLHGNLFRLYRTGTSLTSYEWTDIVTLAQGERAVLEFTYKFPGQFMFHAHQSEFAELGWSGIFRVEEPGVV